MKYVILIHANPQPWGHPTGDFIAENLALPEEVRDQLMTSFVETLTELERNGELLHGEALGDPASATLYRWVDGSRWRAPGRTPRRRSTSRASSSSTWSRPSEPRKSSPPSQGRVRPSSCGR